MIDTQRLINQIKQLTEDRDRLRDALVEVVRIGSFPPMDHAIVQVATTALTPPETK